MKLDVILVPVDFSDLTQSVYDAAAQLAAKLDAKVVVLNVTEPQIEYVGMTPPQAFTTSDSSVSKAAEAALQEASDFFVSRGVRVDTVYVVGAVLPSILAEIEKSQAGLIVLGSHGHGAIYSLLVGSTAEGVIRHSKVPVLVVPGPRDAKKK